MYRKTWLLILLTSLTLVLSPSCKNRVEAKRDGCNIKVGIVFDIGGKNDRSFNAAAWEGVKRAQQDLNVCLYDVEPGNPTSIEPAMPGARSDENPLIAWSNARPSSGFAA